MDTSRGSPGIGAWGTKYPDIVYSRVDSAYLYKIDHYANFSDCAAFFRSVAFGCLNPN
jgi:hypothetical protein